MPVWRAPVEGSAPPVRVELPLLRAAIESGKGNLLHLQRYVTICLECDEHEAAMAACEAYLAKDDCDGSVWEFVGAIESDRGDEEAALDAYERWLAGSGGCSASSARLGRSLVESDPERSRQLLRGAIGEPNPTRKLARDLMGGLFRVGLFREACEYYKSVSERFSFDASLKYNYLRSMFAQEFDSDGKASTLASLTQLIQVRHIDFECPLEEVNERLARFLDAHPDIRFEPKGITTRRGSQVSLRDQSQESVRELLDKLKLSVVDYIRSMGTGLGGPLFSKFPLELRMNAWGVVLGKGGHQATHIHPEGIVSGVYYVSVPAAVEESCEPSQGWLELGSEDWKNRNDEIFLRYVKPVEGELVLFPSFVPHGTIPLETDDTRICVAFDVCEAAD